MNKPAHRIGCRLHNLQVTDAKSLYGCVVSQGNTLSDKRSLISIRAVQETVSAESYHWVPTHLQHADPLTKVDLELREQMRCWLLGPASR